MANRAVRAMVTAFLWMRPAQTVATEVFPTEEQATDWATARLHAAGLHVGDRSYARS